jgi:hypothetical protein
MEVGSSTQSAPACAAGAIGPNSELTASQLAFVAEVRLRIRDAEYVEKALTRGGVGVDRRSLH